MSEMNFWIAIGLLVNAIGFILLIFESIVVALGKEWQVFLTKQETSRVGEIWRNISLDEAGFYRPEDQKSGNENLDKTITEIHKEISILKAAQNHENDLQEEIIEPIRRRRAYVLAAGFTLSLVGIVIQLYALFLAS